MSEKISAYFFFRDYQHNPNEIVSEQVLESYRTESENFVNACDFILKNLQEDTAEEMQRVFYDAGKQSYGEDALRQFFGRLYTLLFNSKQGPRFGTFMLAYGVDEFKCLLENKINNPFDFPV